jgi:ACR3 family arsenite transporter
MEVALTTPVPAQTKRLNPFERYLSLWVALCIVVGVLLGRAFPGLVDALRTSEFGEGSHINFPIALLNVGQRPAGLLITVFVN